MDTIFALATAPGRAGVAVIRVSGPRAPEVAGRLCGTLPAPRRASVRRLYDDSGLLLDEAIVVVFEEGHSFTGEAVAELHLHGSPAVVRAVLGVLAGMEGLRQAAAGEFTRRALENGRLDLAQVEGLADVLSAETEAQRRQAQRVLSGAVGRRAEGWRGRLIRAAALIEATIDFADEDVPSDVWPEVSDLLQALVAEFRAEIAGSAVAERVRDGFEVAIVGKPNIGKSTLINYLAGREAALTSEIAGTTRDVIEVRLDIAGLAVTFLDTAGIRASDDRVERMGIDRALDRAQAADLRVFLVENLEEALPVTRSPDDLVLVAKADLGATASAAVSGVTGHGVDMLIEQVSGVLSERAAGVATVTRARHRDALGVAVQACTGALWELQEQRRSEVCAEEVRTALRALDELVGRVDVEHVLGDIFQSFCIGK